MKPGGLRTIVGLAVALADVVVVFKVVENVLLVVDEDGCDELLSVVERADELEVVLLAAVGAEDDIDRVLFAVKSCVVEV